MATKAVEEHRRHDGETEDEGRGEPVVLVAFLEHGLECRQADRHGHDASPVAFLQEGEPHRLALEREGEHDDHHGARRGIDEEDRLPTVVLRQIATDCRADRRREGYRQREERETDGLLRLGQLGEHHGEGHRDQDATGKTLQATHDDHRSEVMGEGAGDGEDREQDRVRYHVASEREHLAQIVGQRNHDDLADQIGGRDPSAVVDAGADAALDIEERSVGDLNVQDRHERADHAGEHRDPRCKIGFLGRVHRKRHSVRRAKCNAVRHGRASCVRARERLSPSLPILPQLGAAATSSRWSDRPTCRGATRLQAGCRDRGRS